MPDERYQRFTSACEDYTPAPTRVVVEGDFRPRIILPGQGGRLLSDFSADLGDLLSDKPIFNRGGVVSVLNESKKKLEMISSSAFRSTIERSLGIVCQNWVERRETCHLEDMTMNEECARATMVSPDLLSKLREVRRINNVRQPVTRENGAVELLPAGYDQASKIYSFDAVDFDEEMEIGDAMNAMDELLKDCAFSKTDAERSRAATIAMMLATFCDCMFGQRIKRPVFIVQANTAGAGKTILVQMAVATVFGPAILTPPPPAASQEKIMELLHAIAQSAVPYAIFDNWRGNIQNAALEAFITANMWGGRILGTSFTFEVEKQCLVFITANDAVINDDMRRRSLIIELFVEEMKASDRKVSRPIEEDDILTQRSQILAALWAFTRNWINQGSKAGSVFRIDYSKWGSVIGGIIESLGLPNPLSEPKLVRGGETLTEAFLKIIPEVFKDRTVNEVYVKPSELLGIARSVGAFAWILNTEVASSDELSEKEARSERTKFSRQCEKVVGRSFSNGIHFDSIGDGHTKRYKFTKPTA